jgi:hypothetical protein
MGKQTMNEERKAGAWSGLALFAAYFMSLTCMSVALDVHYSLHRSIFDSKETCDVWYGHRILAIFCKHQYSQHAGQHFL